MKWGMWSPYFAGLDQTLYTGVTSTSHNYILSTKDVPVDDFCILAIASLMCMCVSYSIFPGDICDELIQPCISFHL